jgi:heptaprenylglyceryl phosphate synthase
MNILFKAKKLSPTFDAKFFLSELNSIKNSKWITHRFHKTGHDVIPLISSNGDVTLPLRCN